MMQDLHVELYKVLPWQKQRSVRRLYSLAKSKVKVSRNRPRWPSGFREKEEDEKEEEEEEEGGGGGEETSIILSLHITFIKQTIMQCMPCTVPDTRPTMSSLQYP